MRYIIYKSINLYFYLCISINIFTLSTYINLHIHIYTDIFDFIRLYNLSLLQVFSTKAHVAFLDDQNMVSYFTVYVCIYQFLYLYIYIFVNPSLYNSIYLCIFLYLSVYIFVKPSIYEYISIYLSIHLTIYISINQSCYSGQL